ncbi:MAG TPA: SCO family protein [Candidatus Methylomirabilis sp.]|nr:SCO family protein [Candidatus Methylomirabilis sp.]
MGRNTAIAVTLTLAVMTLTSGGVRPVSAAPQGSPWGANYFPNVPLITQDGQTVHFYDDLLKGKAVLVNLIYTSCSDTCPLETARLAQVQKLMGDRVGKDIFFYSITIDPKRDTPAVLKAYMAKFHVGPGWTFLTGKKADIQLLSKKLGLSSLTDVDNRDGHQASLMLGDEATGQWMRHGAVDNPKFLAVAIANFLDNGKPRAATRTYAEAAPLPMPAQGAHLFAGQHLFQSRCAACHTLGHGDGIGPDLLGVTARRDRPWLTRFISTPDQMLLEKDPIATELFTRYKEVRMPNLRLGPEDVVALLAYLEAQGAAQQGVDRKAAMARALGSSNPARHEHQHSPGGP